MTKTLIIAEIGINHNGDFNQALLMIKAAKDSGADVAKFQYYDVDKVLGVDHPANEYAKSCQFTKEQHEALKKTCDEEGIEYLVSVFDVEDIEWADSLCKRHKVASRMNKNQAFINRLGKIHKEVIISTQQYDPLNLADVRYMYCITNYPTKLEEFQHIPFSRHLGLSSHCPSIFPSLYAASHGATVLENHVTFSRGLPGCDQSSSITFEELALLSKGVREIEQMR